MKILKKALLIITMLVTVLFISLVDVIYEYGYFLITLGSLVVLIFLCCKIVSEEDLWNMIPKNLIDNLKEE